ncbi:hypothetical protein RGQ15_06130 [Paracoccus sp. MBLB3053]|uniref:Uncharacterized protein n=1 Tax=Paracoccus aurantius TaxID=3073814 RepID=A0ABU2HRJ1_9RHOB|nr:hypothetical protein [Paracoccus sp. MBLB3053]MDS9467150.1 hypothetical protein [Paracoccus sp. MBLB3053]
MRRAGAALLIFATLAFVASTLIYALRPAGLSMDESIGRAIPTELGARFGEADASLLDLSALFIRPRVLAMSLLIVMTWTALSGHALRRLVELRRLRAAERVARREAPPSLNDDIFGPPTPDQMLERHKMDDTLTEHGLLSTGLAAGAIWPWLMDSRPTAALLFAGIMLTGFLGAALRGTRDGMQVRQSAALGFAAGWATLATCALFATILQKQLGASQTLAAAIGILIAALASVSIQLRLGPNISYSVAVIWGMIGIAAGSVAAQATLATMAVLGIAVIAVALVRVTT